MQSVIPLEFRVDLYASIYVFGNKKKKQLRYVQRIYNQNAQKKTFCTVGYLFKI